MQFSLRNILKIGSADINVGGLTVLAGENNTGKSTIGKTLFSLLKATIKVKQWDEEKAIADLKAHLQRINRLFGLRRMPDGGVSDIALLIAEFINDGQSFVHWKEDILSTTKETIKSARPRKMVENSLLEIEGILLKLGNPNKALSNELEQIFRNEFRESVVSFGCRKGQISFVDDTESGEHGVSIDVAIESNNKCIVTQAGNPSLSDITFVESPLYLQIFDYLNDTTSSISLNRNRLPLHITDLSAKLASEGFIDLSDHQSLFEDDSSTTQKIRRLIGGVMCFDKSSQQIVLKSGSHVIPSISVASGIKAVGLLQRLLSCEMLSPTKMLVWDEPEIHLHPEWQVVFAHMLIRLVAEGIPVVISTHSPYMLQALRYWAVDLGVEKDTFFYLSEPDTDSGLCVFKDVTTNLNSAFSRLASPLRQIMNIDALRSRHT